MLEQFTKNIDLNTEWSYNPQREVDDFNTSSGTLEGYDCPTCRNKGLIAFVHDGDMSTKKCVCIALRRNARNLRDSGLDNLVESCLFETYEVTTPWQQHMLDTARAYALDGEGSWLYIGGQVGCGKTHLCTATAYELMLRGMTGKYMLWRDDSAMLKANVNEDIYGEKMREYKKAGVLYIDDLFKNEQNAQPTPADIRLAFEIINYRYNDPHKATIISSEKSVDEILAIDEALGSRIYQRTKRFCVFIARDRDKNYRLRG